MLITSTKCGVRQHSLPFGEQASSVYAFLLNAMIGSHIFYPKGHATYLSGRMTYYSCLDLFKHDGHEASLRKNKKKSFSSCFFVPFVLKFLSSY